MFETNKKNQSGFQYAKTTWDGVQRPTIWNIYAYEMCSKEI